MPANATVVPTLSLAWREIIRFCRQGSRVFGAIATPLMLWVAFGSGFGSSFKTAIGSQGGYLEYFFPGMLSMLMMFTAIFSLISLIEDRNNGFLQGVQVAPISRMSIVLGKVLGATVLSVAQAMFFLALAPAVGITLGILQVIHLFGAFMVISLMLTLLGFPFAWRSRSIQGFHVIMNVVLMPMWLLSGATFPVTGAHPIIGWLVRVNPMTYSVSWIRQALYQDNLAQLGLAPLWVSIFVVVLSTLGLFLWSVWETRRSTAAL